MKTLLMVLLLSCSLSCIGQITKVNTPPAERVLIEDETWIVASGKSSFRVITSNDTIASRFMRKMEDKMTRFSYIQKKDRLGKYWERSFYFKNEEWNDVVLFVRNKFR